MSVRDDLRFGSEKHRRVLSSVLSYRDFSLDKMRGRYDQWIKNDEAFIAYMPEKDADRRRKNLRDQGEPQFTTLKVPFDYAVLMSYHTYVTSVFLGRNPIFQYMGRQGQGESAKMAVESMIDYQVQVGRMLPQLYVWLLDVGKYGLGYVAPYWHKDQIIINEEIEVQDEFLGVDLGTTRKEMQRKVITAYEGNCLYNIRPYDAYPDPRVTPTNLQQGEFFGRHAQVNWNSIVKGAAQGRYFNTDVVRDMRNGTLRTEEGSPQIIYPVRPGEVSYTTQGYPSILNGVDLLEMYIELIPREWGLHEGSYPEKWAFGVANDEVIVAAQPMGYHHNKFPVAALEGEPEGYSLFKRGLLELVGPMNDIMTWLFNTHFYNTRKALNDMFIVDPSKVVMKDLLDPKPGKIIRLKEEMYGQDVRTALTQFPVTDVTQMHMQDAQVISSLIQRVSGVNDNIMGLVNSGGRKTATEVRTSSTFGINRLKTQAEWFSATGFSDLSQMLLQSTQQMMTAQQQVRIAGDMMRHPGAENALIVGPKDIAGFYDFIPVDGTLPVDRFAQVSLWSQMLSQMAQAPQVLTQYDLGKIFAYVAQLAGLRNISSFRIDVQSPEALAQQAAAGNVIPLGGQGGGARRGNRPRQAGGPPVTSGPSGVAVAA